MTQFDLHKALIGPVIIATLHGIKFIAQQLVQDRQAHCMAINKGRYCQFGSLSLATSASESRRGCAGSGTEGLRDWGAFLGYAMQYLCKTAFKKRAPGTLQGLGIWTPLTRNGLCSLTNDSLSSTANFCSESPHRLIPWENVALCQVVYLILYSYTSFLSAM